MISLRKKSSVPAELQKPDLQNYIVEKQRRMLSFSPSHSTTATASKSAYNVDCLNWEKMILGHKVLVNRVKCSNCRAKAVKAKYVSKTLNILQYTFDIKIFRTFLGWKVFAKRIVVLPMQEWKVLL